MLRERCVLCDVLAMTQPPFVLWLSFMPVMLRLLTDFLPRTYMMFFVATATERGQKPAVDCINSNPTHNDDNLNQPHTSRRASR